MSVANLEPMVARELLNSVAIDGESVSFYLSLTSLLGLQEYFDLELQVDLYLSRHS